MDEIRCGTCVGSGDIMGGGMMMIECPACNGLGVLSVQPTNVDIELPKEVVVIDRRSKTYREAISKIMETHKCSREEATMIFDEEFDKL